MKLKPAFYFIFFILILSNHVMGQKIDTIYHINGNILTGDFKSLNYGVVTWKMDGMGTISYEQPKINTIRSSKQFEIKLKNGSMYFGSFDTSAFERKVNIIIANGKELVSIEEIVEVFPIRRNFWLRTSGNFNLGLNYSKGSDIATLTFSGDLNYRKRKSNVNLNWNSNYTFQGDTLNSTKGDISMGWERKIKKKWSFGAIVGWSQNSQLGTKNRITITTAGIYDFVYNRWNRFYSGLGISVQQETPYDTTGVTNDLVGVATIGWKVYKYTNPKIWVDANISFMPYFTTNDRYRTDVNLSPKISVIGNDLKLGFRFYYTHDTNPAVTAESRSDWGINLEITYSFH